MTQKTKILQKIGFLILLIAIVIYHPPVLADDDDEQEIMQNEMEEIMTETVAKPTSGQLQLNARAGIIYDRTTKEMIWGKNETSKRPMASTTKIMTAIVVLEKGNLSDMVTISKKAAGTGGSTLKIKAGDNITVRDLLYGLMLRSRK